MRLGVVGLRLEQVIPHVGSGQVEIGPNLIQDPIANQELAPDFFVAALDGTKNAHGIDAGEGHQQKESAETDRQKQASVAQIEPLRELKFSELFRSLLFSTQLEKFRELKFSNLRNRLLTRAALFTVTVAG